MLQIVYGFIKADRNNLVKSAKDKKQVDWFFSLLTLYHIAAKVKTKASKIEVKSTPKAKGIPLHQSALVSLILFPSDIQR